MEQKNVLISLVSEQTVPNLELIKEFRDLTNYYLFVHSSQTVNQLQWIIKAGNIDSYDSMEVNPFDIADIEDKLKSYQFSDNQYFLNITGGTKVMILVFQEFFKNLGAKIFYVTGQNNEYLKVFPVIGNRKFKLNSRLTLEEYLIVYGFNIKKGKPLKDHKQSQILLKFFLNNKMTDFFTQTEKIRKNRGKVLSYKNDPELNQFVKESGFIPNEDGKINKKETKYLSGDWLEEYIYYKVKDELALEDDEIGTGYHLKKQDTSNEIDILFVYQHRLFIIECKTSIIDYRVMPDETKRKIKLLPEIIYKSDALRSKFGLFANTSIFTLEEIKNDDGTPIKGYESHFDRADLSKIKIISKKDFLTDKPIKELLKIH